MAAPQIQILDDQIQLAYDNKYGSIWEYSDAFESKKIDWLSILGIVCPICASECAFRRITAYYRRVVDLWPFRDEKVGIARFLCCQEKTTFSLLPHQLIPYVHYTARSVVMTLLIADEAQQKDGQRLFSVAEKLVDENSKVSGYLISCWLLIAVRGLFCSWGSLSDSEHRRTDSKAVNQQAQRLRWVCAFFRQELRICDPPLRQNVMHEFDRVQSSYAKRTGAFFLGVSSQHRRKV